MNAGRHPFQIRLAEGADDVIAAQRLRYRVFVEELGGDGPLVDHAAGLECDEFDPWSDHLLLVDPTRDPAGRNHVVGVYRMMTNQAAAAAGRFYSATEYDLSPLIGTGRPMLELGRSCLDKSCRGGNAMYQLWHALAAYVLERRIEILFGVASFHGCDVAALAEPLAYLHRNHLAPPDLRVRAIGPARLDMDLMPPDQIDAKRVMRTTPALIKAYLRLGGFVGDGAFVDRAFNTTDTCLILDIARMNPRQREIYSRGVAA